jgi:hypothetical protein
MRYFWVGDKEAQDIYEIKWHPGQENLADYQSKHHIGSHHLAVRPWYLHEINPPLVLPRAARPSTLKGCVGNLPEGYIRNVPLPRVPRDQSTFQSRVPHVRAIPVYNEETHVIPTYNSTCRIGERVATANSPQWQPIAINTQNNLLSNLNGNSNAIVALSTSGTRRDVHLLLGCSLRFRRPSPPK